MSNLIPFLFALSPILFALNTSDDIDINIISSEIPEGQKIYEVYCKICHGKDGKRVLTGYYDLAESSLEGDEIRSVILKGRNAMYAYESILNSEEVNAVTSYVLSLRPE